MLYTAIVPLLLAAAPCPAPVEVAWLPDAVEPASPGDLPIAKGQLAKRVAFWREVWSDVPEGVWLVVDRYKPWLQRGRLDCRGMAKLKSDDERAALCKDARRHLYLAAAKKHGRVVLVEGKADALQRARARGAPHRARVRSIFAQRGVPQDLADLAIVESLFRPNARSRAGAVGAYQFVQGSAKPWLRVDKGVDERLDVYRAADAAAAYLAKLHARFDDWPLAVTSYNAGPTRIARIQRKAGTKSLDGLLKSRTARRAPRFGFDAYNYWAQVEAVSTLVRADRVPEPEPAVAARSSGKTRVRNVARCFKVKPHELLVANPALLDQRSWANVPRGYVFTIPRPASGGAG